MKPHLRTLIGNAIGKKIFRLAIPAALVLISACSVGPDYVRPALETPAAYKENEAATSSQSLEDVARRNWWEIFADPELDSLEQQVEISNQNIAQAEAQFRQARALVQAARAAYFPTVTVGLGMTRTAP
ncbi:MAG: TolC family protein, partial [Candidatus Binatia bacterium]